MQGFTGRDETFNKANKIATDSITVPGKALLNRGKSDSIPIIGT